MVETRRLIELDPVSPTPSGHLGYQYLASRQWDLAIAQYQKALAQYQKALAMDLSQIDEYCELGEAFLGKLMYPEAIAEMSRSVEMSRTGAQYPLYLARLGNARAQAGDTAGARKILSELPSDDPSDAAYVYAGLGEHDKSIALLKEAYRRHTFPLDSGPPRRVGFSSFRSPLQRTPPQRPLAIGRFVESFHLISGSITCRDYPSLLPNRGQIGSYRSVSELVLSTTPEFLFRDRGSEQAPLLDQFFPI